jgi:hypothetical protein
VQVGGFWYDGTADLLRECKRIFGGCTPPLTPSASASVSDAAAATSRPLHASRASADGAEGTISRADMVQWMANNAARVDPAAYATTAKMCSGLQSDDPAAMEVFHRVWWPPGVESSAYSVNQTLVTVQATYLLTPEPGHLSRGASSSATGPSTCLPGYDKHTASSSDLVCVPPQL